MDSKRLKLLERAYEAEVNAALSGHGLHMMQTKALAGDTRAAAQFRVAKWNASVPVGTEVFYVKSQAEGKCRLKTVGAAFVMGEDQPVVDLVGIGPVALDKTEPTFD